MLVAAAVNTAVADAAAVAARGGEAAETAALAGEEAVAVAAAVAELAVDDNMARWRNGPVCMLASA